MPYVKYENLHNPNEVLEKMAEYIKTRGYTVINDIADDLNIYDMSTSDGKKFVFMDRTNTYYIYLRSANGTNIFGSDDATMDTIAQNSGADCDTAYYGIGMTAGEGYSKTQRWYNQYLTPNTKGGTYINGVWIPINNRDGEQKRLYTLWCNNITAPSDTLVFSVTAENTDYNYAIGLDTKAVHLCMGNLEKYDNWNGGFFFSGSSTPSLMKEASKLFELLPNTATEKEILAEHFVTHDSGILPILSSGSISNTFLRIDIDDAPKQSRGLIRWASSGTDNVTGKKLSMPVRVSNGGNGEIPKYAYLQSQNSLDWGKNINTLNCITLNMPNFMAVQVDPDILENYAGAGQVSGVYFVSSLNMQTTKTYEMSYPKSNDLCQIFPYSCRRGRYGFDAISIRQKEDASDDVDESTEITTDTSRIQP